ncbi:response regulator [Paenibacillus silviterrae]|uniref:response regulator n=1 Tax=Paenibacillus silviterrae TaxID=3242194 RepID=UPI002542FA3B|nr:response regulator [Paenibacillus chinjuensis]
MIKMLVVDDERTIREGIKNIVPWEEYGIKIIGTACDGEQAMKLCDEESPHIVITDIRMPKKTGLELAEYIRSKGDDVKVVMLSGHDDFAYAQQALKLGVTDYLLKPIMPDQLVEMAVELKTTVELEQKHKEEECRLREQVRESLPLLKERFFIELVSGHLTDPNVITQRIRFLGMNWSNQCSYCTAVLQLDGFEIDDEITEERRQLLQLAVFNQLQATLQKSGEVFMVNPYEYGLLVHSNESTEKVVTMIKEMGDELRNWVQSDWGFNITLGIGSPCGSLHEVKESFLSAQEAIKYKVLLGSGQTIYINEIENTTTQMWRYSEAAEKETVFAVKNADKRGIRPGIEHFFENSGNPVEPEYVQVISMRLLSSVSLGLMEIGENAQSYIGSEPELWDRIKKLKTVPQIQALIIALLEEAAEQLMVKRSNKSSRVIEMVNNYLEEHFTEPLSLEKLAAFVYLSPSYICSLYKQETGQNISDTITLLRVNKAKELLSGGNVKIYEVANRLGYTDSRYFNKVFKKYTGMNLTDYRQSVEFEG